MDKTDLFKILDIDAADGFKYYENMASLMEEERHIDETLLAEFISELDMDVFAEMLNSYFDEFVRVIPDECGDFELCVDSVRMSLIGSVTGEMTDEETASFAKAVAEFRRWYTEDMLVSDIDSGEKLRIRDARYNFIAAELLGDKCNYDFSDAIDCAADGYDVRISDIIDRGEL